MRDSAPILRGCRPTAPGPALATPGRGIEGRTGPTILRGGTDDRHLNPKGQPGTWRPATWDEALGLVAEKIREVRARDRRLLLWQKGRSKAHVLMAAGYVDREYLVRHTNAPFLVGEDGFRDHLAQATPEWAAGICGVPAEAIRRVARELGRNAMIGSATVLDGRARLRAPAGRAVAVDAGRTGRAPALRDLARERPGR